VTRERGASEEIGRAFVVARRLHRRILAASDRLFETAALIASYGADFADGSASRRSRKLS
jgi:hypothetical protein